MLGFVGQLQEKIEALTNEINAINKKYYETASISVHALWEYDIASKTLHLIKKIQGKYAEDNKDIPDYRQKMLDWKIVHPEDIDIFNSYCDSMDNGDSKFSYEYRQITDNNVFVWLRSEGSTVFDNAGNPKKVIGRTIDITSDKEKNEVLLNRANTDFLTKLNSKDYAFTLINQLLQKEDTKTSGFLLIDIDDFKSINDSYGHSFGDSILLQTATILMSHKNTNTDVVGRLGGDEMCVFLYDIKDRNDIMDYYLRVKDFLNKVTIGQNDHVKISVGAVIFPDMAKDIDELLVKADLALYHTKFTSKNDISFYDSSMKMDYSVGPSSNRIIESLSAIENIEVINRNVFNPIKVKDDLIYSYEAFDCLDSAYYIIDKDYKINYCSPNIKNVFPACEKVTMGSYCYETIRNEYAPCSDCPLKNNSESNVHFSNNYDNSKMDYNVTVKKINENENSLICWNNLSDFTTNPNYVTDFITGLDVYSTFIIKCNSRIKARENAYKMIYINLPWFRDFSKGSNFNIAIDLIKEFTAFLKSKLNSDELMTVTTPHEFYLFVRDDGDFSKKINKYHDEADNLLSDKFMADLSIDVGIESVKSSDNNAHVIAQSAKKNSGGYNYV